LLLWLPMVDGGITKYLHVFGYLHIKKFDVFFLSNGWIEIRFPQEGRVMFGKRRSF
jgi:hypothetical protein